MEYKGEGWMDTGDTEEKEDIGNLWAAKSNGKCIFLLVGLDDYAQKLLAI